MPDRLESLSGAVYNKLASLQTVETVTWSYIYMEHLANVSILAALLARKRGLDAELCQAAGLLHDLWLYEKGFPMTPEEHRMHGEYGSVLAREMLGENGGFSGDEIEIICRAIFNHNYKDAEHGEYDELLKDADAFAHVLKNTAYDRKYQYHGREKKVLDELGLQTD